MKLFVWAALPAAAALCVGTANAQSLPVIGGTTSVKLTSAATLTSLGLTVGTLGSAMFSPGSDGVPLVYFPVTGGVLNTASFAGSIQHEGSGLTLSSSSATVSLRNFVIDTAALRLSGDVTIGATTLDDVPLFAIGLSGNPFLPFTLAVTPTAGAALQGVFGVNLTGAAVGLASTVPISAIPEPATYATMVGGLALLGWAAARRRRPAAQAARPEPLAA